MKSLILFSFPSSLYGNYRTKESVSVCLNPSSQGWNPRRRWESQGTLAATWESRARKSLGQLTASSLSPLRVTRPPCSAQRRQSVQW